MSLRRLAEAAYSPVDFEYLMGHESFRSQCESPDMSAKAFEELCQLGETLLAKRPISQSRQSGSPPSKNP